MLVNASLFTKIAGVSGALAVALGAYGSHSKFINDDPHKVKVFEAASRYHLLHSIALLCIQNVNRPMLTGGLLVSGTLLFSGTLYSIALYDAVGLRRLAPIGGTLLILGWLSMAF